MLAMARALATGPEGAAARRAVDGARAAHRRGALRGRARIAAEGVSILIVEQFAHEVLGVADVAAIMLHGRIELVGPPAEIGPALDRAYLGGSIVG